MKSKLEKPHKTQKLFILLYLVPICYIMLDSVAEAFEYNPVVFSFFSTRIEILILATIYGLMYVFSKRKNNMIVTNTLVIAICFSIYMTTRGLFSLSDVHLIPAFFSCVFLWSLTFFITTNVIINEKEKQIISYIVGFTGLGLAMFYFSSLQSKDLMEVAATNSIYYVLCSIPFMFVIKNKYVKIPLLFIVSITLIASTKTTCIISLIIILVYGLFNFKFDFPNRKNLFFTIFLASLVIYFWFFDLEIHKFFINDDFFGDLQTGNGRYDIYENILVIFTGSNWMELFFGHGYSSVSKALNLGAHNDFLQILFDYGLFGFVFYVSFIVSLINSRKMLEKKSLEYFAYNVSILIFLQVSFASNFINSQVQMMFFVFFWGFFSNNKIRSQ